MRGSSDRKGFTEVLRGLFSATIVEESEWRQFKKGLIW